MSAIPSPAWAEKRVALVIGNASYAFAPRLDNPANDAGDIAQVLRELGFDVTHVADQSYQEMRIALRDFSDRATGADIAAVFYAGHGIEIDKQNYLIPVDARLGTDRNVRFETIPLDDVLLATEGAKGLRIVILDACRENPFTTTMSRSGATRSIGRGLARVEPEGSSVLVAFAAREGQVADDGEGRNSPYTAALLDNLSTPGVEVGLLFRRVREAVIAGTGRAQEPFVYQSLGADPIYLVPPNDAEPSERVAAPQPPAAVLTGLDQPAQAWAATKDTQSIAVLKAFIERFADTVYGDLAKARLEELETQALAALGPPRAKPQSSAVQPVAVQPPAVQPAVTQPPSAQPTPPPALPQSAALPLPRGTYSTSYGAITFNCLPDGNCTGNYKGSGDKKPARITGRISADGRLSGFWIEAQSNKRCSRQVGGSLYWGKVVFSFDSSRDAWSGSWGYCDDSTNRSWDGKR